MQILDDCGKKRIAQRSTIYTKSTDCILAYLIAARVCPVELIILRYIIHLYVYEHTGRSYIHRFMLVAAYSNE